MNKAQRDIRRKTRVLEHAARIGNVRKTCRYFGVVRSGFYVWKKAYETHGAEGLVNQKPCPSNPRLRTGGSISSAFSLCPMMKAIVVLGPTQEEPTPQTTITHPVQ